MDSFRHNGLFLQLASIILVLMICFGLGQSKNCYICKNPDPRFCAKPTEGNTLACAEYGVCTTTVSFDKKDTKYFQVVERDCKHTSDAEKANSTFGDPQRALFFCDTDKCNNRKAVGKDLKCWSCPKEKCKAKNEVVKTCSGFDPVCTKITKIIKTRNRREIRGKGCMERALAEGYKKDRPKSFFICDTDECNASGRLVPNIGLLTTGLLFFGLFLWFMAIDNNSFNGSSIGRVNDISPNRNH